MTGKHTEFQSQVKRLRIDLTHSEVELSNKNHSEEGDIGHLRKRFRKIMLSKKAPKRLWYYGFVHQAVIFNRIARGKTERMDIEEVTGKTPDIS